MSRLKNGLKNGLKNVGSIIFMCALLLLVTLEVGAVRQIQQERRSGIAQVSNKAHPGIHRVISRAAAPKAFASELNSQTVTVVVCSLPAVCILLSFVISPVIVRLLLRSTNAQKKLDAL